MAMRKGCAVSSASMLNAVGLQNDGVEVFCQDKLPRLPWQETAIIANIYAGSVEEFAELAARLNAEEGVAALEVNVSCPNVKEGGVLFGQDPALAAQVTAAVRRAAPGKHVMVKLSPNVTDIALMARSVEDAGADSISCINTLLGMACTAGLSTAFAVAADAVSRRLLGRGLRRAPAWNLDKYREARQAGWLCDNSRICRELGFAPRVSLEAGMQDNNDEFVRTNLRQKMLAKLNLSSIAYVSRDAVNVHMVEDDAGWRKPGHTAEVQRLYGQLVNRLEGSSEEGLAGIMATVAEGVETREQIDFLAENGCSAIQGYIFSQALSGSDFATYLKGSAESIAAVMA